MDIKVISLILQSVYTFLHILNADDMQVILNEHIHFEEYLIQLAILNESIVSFHLIDYQWT